MSSDRVIDEYCLHGSEDYILESDPNASEKYAPTKVSNAKQLNEIWWKLQETISVQPNWGRIQQVSKEEYETLIPTAVGQIGSRRRNLIRQSKQSVILDQLSREEPLEIDDVAGYLLTVGQLSIIKLFVKLKKRGASPEQFESLRNLVNKTLEKELNELDSVEDFVTRAQRLESKGNIDAALDLIYDSVDELFLANRFDQCNEILQNLKAVDYSVDVLIALLTSTLPASHLLPSRKQFFTEVENVLIQRAEFETGILFGLEG